EIVVLQVRQVGRAPALELAVELRELRRREASKELEQFVERKPVQLLDAPACCDRFAHAATVYGCVESERVSRLRYRCSAGAVRAWSEAASEPSARSTAPAPASVSWSGSRGGSAPRPRSASEAKAREPARR